MYTFIQKGYIKLIKMSVNLMFLKQHIIMISEESCEIEDWSNAENSALHHRNKLHFTIYSHVKILF